MVAAEGGADAGEHHGSFRDTHTCTHVGVFAIREGRWEVQAELQRSWTWLRIRIPAPQSDRVQTQLIRCRPALSDLSQDQTPLDLPARGNGKGQKGSRGSNSDRRSFSLVDSSMQRVPSRQQR